MKVKDNKIARYQIDKTGELCCTLCGTPNGIARFKGGYICEGCLQYVKTHK